MMAALNGKYLQPWKDTQRRATPGQLGQLAAVTPSVYNHQKQTSTEQIEISVKIIHLPLSKLPSLPQDSPRRRTAGIGVGRQLRGENGSQKSVKKCFILDLLKNNARSLSLSP